METSPTNESHQASQKPSPKSETPVNSGKAISVPIRMTLTGPGGESTEIVLDGADVLQVSRIDLAQAANNLEHAIRAGCFAAQPLEKQHAVMGLAIRLKELSSTPLEGAE